MWRNWDLHALTVRMSNGFFAFNSLVEPGNSTKSPGLETRRLAGRGLTRYTDMCVPSSTTHSDQPVDIAWLSISW